MIIVLIKKILKFYIFNQIKFENEVILFYNHFNLVTYLLVYYKIKKANKSPFLLTKIYLSNLLNFSMYNKTSLLCYDCLK